MLNSPTILMQDYDYELPQVAIAQKALEPRDASKLLFYNNHQIKDAFFSNIAEFIPPNAQLFFNDAKVIPARIIAQKESGASIEIFLLKPYFTDYFTSLNNTAQCEWECLVGNKKKWKEHEKLQINILIDNIDVTVLMEWQNRETNSVRLSWNNSIKFIDILEQIGKIPLPPYIKRPAEVNDNKRYQTIYSATQGSVAAPTAGLHFTEDTIKSLTEKNIPMHAVTLHISAGTFLPVTSDYAHYHNMHQEIFSIDKRMLLNLKESAFTIAVGTTSVRVLESIYWCAMNLKSGIANPFEVEKLAPYKHYSVNLNPKEAIQILLDDMAKKATNTLTGATSIMIMPGYDFKFIKGLITNFHQPKSTLLLLIAAFTGANRWKDIYSHALLNNYRFLSYGDSSLLLK